MDIKSTTCILIDLDKSKDAALFDQGELLQQRAWRDITKKIESSGEDAKKLLKTINFTTSDHNAYYPRNHRALAVFGRRGDGKTTFVLNILKHLSEKKEGPKIFPLDLIDPTLIEAREHPLLHIISDIKSRVTQAYALNPNDKHFQDWQKSLHQLAVGLNALEGIGAENNDAGRWEDPDFVMEEGLKAARGGMLMERHFNEFLARSLACLGKDIFLVAFDDVDIHFDKGWIILETIRKYLTSPLIQVILCGDLELYIHLIRKNYWKMVHSLVRKEGKKKYAGVVRDLEEQYLLKIVRNQNRVTLQPMNALLARNFHVRIKPTHSYEGMDPEPLFRDFMIQKLKECFFLSPHDYALYLDLICHQPIRTVIQVLEALDYHSDQQETVYEALPQIFLSTIVGLGMKLDDFQSVGGGVTLAALAGYLEYRNNWSDPGFQPTRARANHDILNAVINGVYGYEFHKQQASCIAYFVKIGMVSYFQDNYRGNRNNFLEVVGLSAGTPTLETAQRALGLLKERQGQAAGFGVIHLYADSLPRGTALDQIFIHRPTRQNPPPSLTTFINKIEESPNEFWGVFLNTRATLVENIGSWHRYVFQAACSSIVQPNFDRETFVSFYNILGLISDLTAADDKGEFNRRLTRSATETPRPYLASETTNVSKQVTWIDTEPSDDEQTLRIDDTLFRYFQHWKEKESKAVPLYFLHHAFQNTLTSIDKLKDLPAKDRSAGNYIHRFCINFLHSILVEEINQAADFTVVRQPSTFKDTNFLNSINHPGTIFFQWIWSCPLWGFFLDPQSEVWRRYIKQLSNDETPTSKIKELYVVAYKDTTFPNLFPLLNSLAVQGMKILPPTDEGGLVIVPTPDLAPPDGSWERYESRAVTIFNGTENEIRAYLLEPDLTWSDLLDWLNEALNPYFKMSWNSVSWKKKLRTYFEKWANNRDLSLPERE